MTTKALIESENLLNVLRAALFTPTTNGWGLPIYLEGPPGVAKSGRMRHLTAEVGLGAPEVLSPGERGEAAFGVTPVFDGQYLRAPAPGWAERFITSGRGLLFLDELPLAPAMVKPAMLGLLLDKRIGETTLPGGVRVMAAGNPVNVGGGYELLPTEANRVGHIPWTPPSLKDRTEYMRCGGALPKPALDPEQEEKRVMAAWPEAWARACGSEAAYLAARGPDALNAPPKAGSPEASRAWPSSRSWEYATRALASSYVHNLSATETATFVAAFIGDGAADEYMTWLDANDLPDVGALLDDPKPHFEHDPLRADRTVAVLQTAATLVTSPASERQRARANSAIMLAMLLEGQGVALDLLAVMLEPLARSGLFDVSNKTHALWLQKMLPTVNVAATLAKGGA